MPSAFSGSLRASSVSKAFGSVPALQDVSFTLRPGEILGLIGPNGAGKTTLFECLSGVLPVNQGVLLRNDSVLEGSARHELLFYLPDAIAPWSTQTVRWCLDFIIGYFGGRSELLGEVISSLGLEELLQTRVGVLSKGQRKRALLAMGLLAPQPVLLIDEPFEGLDLRQARDAAATLRSHAARGRTLFLSIHQIADAARLCDRFVLLSGGRVRGEGTLAELTAAAGLAEGGTAHALEEVFLALA